MKKKTIIATILVLTSIAFGCKISEIKKQEAPEGGVGPLQPVSVRKFIPSEIETGRRICSNLKKKREFFETLTNEKEQFKFRGELRNCDDGMYNNQLFIASISNANSTDLEYIAQRDTYFKDVVTDQSGVIKQMCDSLNSSDNVWNYIESGSNKYKFSFLIADGYDRYDIQKMKKNQAGVYEMVSGESVSLISSKTQASVKFLGVEKERVRYTMCDQKRYNTIRQTWVEAITTF